VFQKRAFVSLGSLAVVPELYDLGDEKSERLKLQEPKAKS
jgi:hypothetical protein